MTMCTRNHHHLARRKALRVQERASACRPDEFFPTGTFPRHPWSRIVGRARRVHALQSALVRVRVSEIQASTTDIARDARAHLGAQALDRMGDRFSEECVKVRVSQPWHGE